MSLNLSHATPFLKITTQRIFYRRFAKSDIGPGKPKYCIVIIKPISYDSWMNMIIDDWGTSNLTRKTRADELLTVAKRVQRVLLSILSIILSTNAVSCNLQKPACLLNSLPRGKDQGGWTWMHWQRNRRKKSHGSNRRQHMTLDLWAFLARLEDGRRRGCPGPAGKLLQLQKHQR